MTKFTEKAILDTFDNMLARMPFKKITVSAIVAECGISSNTFYYHFNDIYNLLERWMESRLGSFINAGPGDEYWTDTTKRCLRLMKDNPDKVYNMSGSISREMLENYCFTKSESQFRSFIDGLDGIEKVTEKERDLLAGFYCYSLLGFILKFCWAKMELDIDESVDALEKFYRGLYMSLIADNIKE